MNADIRPDEGYYRDTWDLVQQSENREVVESLEVSQLSEEDVLEEVDLPKNEFYKVVENLEKKDIVHHYQEEHGPGDRTTETSLYRTFYPAKKALEFDNQEDYVEYMLKEDEEIPGQYIE